MLQSPFANELPTERVCKSLLAWYEAAGSVLYPDDHGLAALVQDAAQAVGLPLVGRSSQAIERLAVTMDVREKVEP